MHRVFDRTVSCIVGDRGEMKSHHQNVFDAEETSLTLLKQAALKMPNYTFRGLHNRDARSPGRLNFLWWCLIFVNLNMELASCHPCGC
jgi:hypothetical protein